MLKNNVWILILAAGSSNRMGSPKLLLPIAGESMIRRVTTAAITAIEGHVAIVSGKDSVFKHEHVQDLGVEWIENNESQLGLSSSIRAGVAHLIQHQRPQAILIILGDQPDMDSRTIVQVVEHYQAKGGSIVQVKYTDRPGHPVLFDEALFPELLQLEGDYGAKNVLRAYQESIQWVAVQSDMPEDIDTPEEYEAYVSRNPK
ncbi:molybdenum cofactor cytidylyltransferase [Paenibacillus sp. DS2015]|uniref:nucleotidyltransferase family protein n=1 Tax=Paenibacillus sp. DS2015 TaxID=3373917 RepID=UPI003D23FED4